MDQNKNGKPVAALIIATAISILAVCISLSVAAKAQNKRKVAEASLAAAERRFHETIRAVDEREAKIAVLLWGSKEGAVDKVAVRILDVNTAKAEVLFADGRVARLNLQGHERKPLNGEGPQVSLPSDTKLHGEADANRLTFVAFELPWRVAEVVSIMPPSYNPSTHQIVQPPRELL